MRICAERWALLFNFYLPSPDWILMLMWDLCVSCVYSAPQCTYIHICGITFRNSVYPEQLLVKSCSFPQSFLLFWMIYHFPRDVSWSMERKKNILFRSTHLSWAWWSVWDGQKWLLRSFLHFCALNPLHTKLQKLQWHWGAIASVETFTE